MDQNLYEIESAAQFQQLLAADLARVSLISFWAPWAAPCRGMTAVVDELATKHPRLLVLKVEAEEQADISESFGVESVPSLLLLQGHTLLDRIVGADAASLVMAVERHLSPAGTGSLAPETPEELTARTKTLTRQSKVVLFIKGSPDVPRCGFSRQIVGILREHGVEFTHFDILTDEGVRAELKVLNEWPTFPQLIVDGEFVGGLDVVKEMVETGELQEVLGDGMT